MVADALSWLEIEALSMEGSLFMGLSSLVISTWMERLKRANTSDQSLLKLRQKWHWGELKVGFSDHHGYLVYHDHYCIGQESSLRGLILEELHNSKIGVHIGYFKTLLWI